MTQMMEAPGGPGPESPWSPPAPPRPPAPRSRPGWTGVVAISAGAALLSSLLTAGATGAFGGSDASNASSTVPAAVSARSGQAVAPLVTGTTTVPNWVSVGSAVEPSVVSVRVESADGSGGEGSGVVLDSAGRILTNNHVVADGSGGSISVVLSDGRTYAATLVGADPSTDLAVIAMTNPPKGLKAATFGDSSAVKVGDPVMAVGNPLGLADTATTGIVSALDRPVATSTAAQQQLNPFGRAQAQTEQVVTNAIQTDAAINPGNSGGALVDAGGRVIGITSTIASLGVSGASQAGSIGLGFAIPSNEAKDVAKQLIATGSVQHAYLGVTLADGTVTVDGADRQAAVVGDVTAGAPAAAAGLRAGDAITAINGAAVDGADSLVGRIRAIAPGTKVTLNVVRGGKAQTIAPTLAVRPTTGSG